MNFYNSTLTVTNSSFIDNEALVTALGVKARGAIINDGADGSTSRDGDHQQLHLHRERGRGSRQRRHGGRRPQRRQPRIMTVSDSTSRGQSAEFGGGIANETGGSATLNNTIVANSTSGGDLSQDSGQGSNFTGSYDLIGDGSDLSSFTHSLQGNPCCAAGRLRRPDANDGPVARQPRHRRW